MPRVVVPSPPQSLVVRLRVLDALVDAELVEQGRHARIRLAQSPVELRKSALERGVDVELFEGPERYAAEDVEVLEFDRASRCLVVAGPLELPQARRRASFREQVEIPVKVGAPVDEHGFGMRPPVALGETFDLGGGGLSFESKSPIGMYPGAPVVIELDLDDAPLRALGQLAWVETRPSGHTSAGLAFTKVEGRGLERLYRFLFARQARRRAESAPGPERRARKPQKS